MLNQIIFFPITRKYEPDLNKLELLLIKGIYPHEYMDNFKGFKETSLLRKEEFYSSLNNKNITDEQYQHVQKVWESYECKNVEDYHNLYVRTNACVLADVFENYRKTCLNQYKLDPAHYFTGPI